MKSISIGGVLLVIGLVALILGLLLYFPAHNTVEEYDSYGIFSDIGKVLSPELKEKYDQAKLMENIGTIIFILEIFLSIIGVIFIAVSNNEK